MAQTYQMKHNPQGTIYSLLTVESDGQMTMTFHGTDREISHEVTENADGWLCYPGAMFPGLASGKWQAVAAQMRNEKLVIDKVALTSVKEMRNENEEMRNEVAVDEPVIVEQPRPRRQRKPRKPRVERQEPAIEHQPSAISPQSSSTLKAIGMVAAATVALFVIYETGLLIPLGLIGLATGGILK